MRLVRIVLLLTVIVLVGPSAAGALASGQVSEKLGIRAVSAAPAQISVANIQFSLERGDNNQPVAPATRFHFGPRKIWAFWSWDNAKGNGRVKYVLRFGNSDVAWGELPTDQKDGRMEVELERLDGDYFNIGTYRLYLDAYDNSTGDVKQASFEIYDDSGRDGDNGNSNSNNNNNDNGDDNNNDNGDNNNSNNNGNDNGDDNNNDNN